jgi:hypothetical protein
MKTRSSKTKSVKSMDVILAGVEVDIARLVAGIAADQKRERAAARAKRAARRAPEHAAA